MQNINELIGIIKGISYDEVINSREIEYLNSWVDGNRCFVTCINEKKLMDSIDKALEDCVLSDSERKTILLIAQELLKNVENQYASYAELNGIIEGIISDDVINIKEMYKLNEWFVSHSEISDENSKCIHTVVEKILEDRIIPQQKRQELFDYLSSKNEYIKFESKLLYLKSLIRNKKNVGIELIDLLDRNDYMLKIHSRAESVLANTLNSYTCFFVEDPDIVILSLTLIAMLDYDGSYYDSVSKVYKSLYDRYSKSKIEGLIRSILNRYRLDIDKSSRPRIINYVLRQAIVPKKFLPNFFEFIFDIYKYNFEFNLTDDLYDDFKFVYEGLQTNMSKNGDELEINVSKKTYKLIQTTKDLLIKEKNMDPLIKLSIMVIRLIDQYMWNRELKLQNQYLKYGFEHWKDIFNKSEELRTEKKTSLKRSRWKPDFVLKNNNIYLLPPVHKVKACYNYRDLRIVVKNNENIFYENCSPNINEIIGGYQIILEPIKIDCPLDKIRYLLMAKNEIIYDSTEKLYRDFIVFNQEGNEIFNNTDYQGTTIFCTRSFLPETQKYYSTNNYILSLLQVKLGESILLEGSIFNFTSLVKPGLFGEKLKDCTLIQLKNEKRYPVYKIIEYLVFEDEKLNCDYKIYINGKCYSLNDFHYRVESNKGINRYIIGLDILKTNIYSILIYRIRLEKNNKIAEFDFVIDSDLYVRTNGVDDKNFEITVNTGLLTQRIEKCVNVENFDFRNIQFEYLRQNYAYEIPLGLSFYRITKDKWHSFSDDLWIYDIKHDTILEIYGINADSISICSPEGIVLDELSINNKGIFGYVEIGFLTSYKEYDYISISMKKNGDAIKMIRCYNKCFIEDNGIEEIYDPITNELMITTDFKGKGKIFYEILDKNNNVFFKGKEKNSNECEHICGFNSFEEYTINILEKPRGLILGKGKILKSIKKIFYGRKDFVGRNFKIKEVYYYEYECENKKLVEKTLPFKMNYVKFTKQIDESTYIGSVYAKTSKGIFWLYKINPVEIEVNSDDILGTMDLYITNEGDGLLLDLKHKNLMNNLEDFNAPYIEIYVVDANGKEEL